MLDLITLSSLEKVFVDQKPEGRPQSSATMLLGEVFSYQIAYRWEPDGATGPDKSMRLAVRSPLAAVSVRQVALVPVDYVTYPRADEDYLRREPGLYPDLLLPDRRDAVRVLPGQWRALWVSIDGRSGALPGVYSIEVDFILGDRTLGTASFSLEVLPAALPDQTLIYTNWFHCDALISWYGCEAFSEDFWRVFQKYVAMAADHGMNMILTPIFTPPLDTAVGGERITTQLVDVTVEGGAYRFGFEKLARWVDVCEELGIVYFEFSHLFTQWGAKHAPKVMATVDGVPQRIFGWETDAGGEAYAVFLRAFLPALKGFIRERGLGERSYFHVSDEPSSASLETYQRAKALLDESLSGFPIIDALSDYAFYETGAVTQPIPANDHIDAFLEHGVPDLWTYYCCAQCVDVANRFIAQASIRNRILGWQMYKFDIKGFLHWGYNFYSAQYSRYAVNPYVSTSADGFVPAGDAFVVYPGPDGPLESLRLKVSYEAFQDMRALSALERKLGRAAVLSLIDEGLAEPIAFNRYPRDAEWLLALRERVNRLLAEA